MNDNQQKTILLVEDEAIIALQEKQELRKNGYNVLHVLNGEDAVKTIIELSSPIDLILMDIDLGSGIDGTEAAEQILKNNDIPIVFLSSHTESEIVEKIEKITSYGYVVKNSGITVLNASIKMACKLFEAKSLTHERDITIRKSEHIMNLVLNNTMDMIAYHDVEHRIIWCNKAYLDGVYFTTSEEKTLSEIQGKKCYDVWNLDRVCINCPVILTIKSGQPCAVEITPQNQPHWSSSQDFWLVRSAPINDLNGNIIGAIEVSQNITERKQNEDALRLYEKIVLSANELMSVIDIDYTYLLVNNSFERFWSIKREDVIGKKVWEVIGEEVFKNSVKEKIDLCLIGNIIYYESYFIFPSFGKRYMHMHYYPYRNEKGEIIGLIIISYDMTNIKESELRLEYAYHEKEILLKEVHHRIKNNICSIESLLSLQSESIRNSESYTILQDAISRVQSMRFIYDKLLISNDYKEASVKSYLDDLITSVMNIFPNKNMVTLQKDIHDFSLNVKMLLPIGIIVNELITNAMKYAFINKESGIINICIMKEENKITLSIQDNGIGFSDEFDLNKTNSLGLMLVKMLTEQYQGTISIENKIGVRYVIKFEI